MNIDLSSLITNLNDEIIVDGCVNISDDLLKNVSIRKLNDVYFNGKVTRISDDMFNLYGNLSGVMTLPDDITLEDVEHTFFVQIDENFGETEEIDENNIEIVQNTIDIIPFLWQNIVVEIPSKIVSEKSQNISLEGEGWRFIREDDIEDIKRENNSPFSDLQKLLDSKEGSE